MISVVIPTRDRDWCVERAVESVLGQEAPEFKNRKDFELIVVDDGSADSTRDLLAPLLKRGDLALVSHPKSLGVSAARNSGIKASKGDLVAFLDSDDIWLPGKLIAQRAYMEARPDMILSQCEELWCRSGRRVNPGKKHEKLEGDIFMPSLARCLVSPSASIARRRLFDEVGYFDESLPACEDYDLWLRVLAAGYSIGLLKEPFVWRNGGHADQLSSKPGLDRYRIRALKKILRLPLAPDRRKAAEAELARRKVVYEAGRVKRAREGKEAGPDF